MEERRASRNVGEGAVPQFCVVFLVLLASSFVGGKEQKDQMTCT
jgi:hypothetical protein